MKQNAAALVMTSKETGREVNAGCPRFFVYPLHNQSATHPSQTHISIYTLIHDLDDVKYPASTCGQHVIHSYTASTNIKHTFKNNTSIPNFNVFYMF
jgi:hypothetical protein